MAENCCKKPAEPQGEPIRWRVRQMRRDDIRRCLEIWLQVELCEGEQTVASALASDPAGFYVAELIPTGEIIGMCAGILVRDDTAFMGFYAVEPRYQGIGVGRELWATTTRRLDESTNIGLYGVPAMSEKYKKSGFRLEDTIRMLIFEGKPGQKLDIELLSDLQSIKLNSHANEPALELQLIDCETSETICRKFIEYDRDVNKFSREKLLRNYIFNESDAPLTLALVRKRHSAPQNSLVAGTASEHEAVSRLASSRPDEEDTKLSCCMSGSLSLSSTDQADSAADKPEDGSEVEILGYGCIRHDNTDGAMVGPIYADSSEICEVLLRNLLERFELPPRGKYSLMTLTSNNRAGEILKRIGLEEMDQCSRMFTKFLPEACLGKIFYVHSPNFSLF